MVKTLRNTLGIFALIYLLTVATYSFWLPLAAKSLLIQDPLSKADVIVVSTGSYARFRYAVELALKSRVVNLLILGDRRVVTVVPGKSPLDMAKEEALTLGLPSGRLTLKHSTSTLVDARVAKKVMMDRGFATAVVISDGYNMMRLAMIFDHVFRESAIGLHYLPAGLDRLHPNQWWLYPKEFKYVVMEWIKMPLDFSRIHFLPG